MADDLYLRYPIGRFEAKPDYSESEVAANIRTIRLLPEKVEELAEKMPLHLWDLSYRPGGWTARQVAHHLPDSHLHAYIRTKWALTEETPLIKAYEQVDWAQTPENKSDPFMSINLLKALHIKWTALLEGLSREQLDRKFAHPETKREVSIKHMTALYAWHGEHHLAHLKLVQNSKS